MITEGIVNPRGIAVYPPEGILAYSNWAEQNPHIGLSGKDAAGGDLKSIVVDTKYYEVL